jgi:hypothetical protein
MKTEFDYIVELGEAKERIKELEGIIDTPLMCELADDITFEVCRLMNIEAEELKDGEYQFTDEAERLYCKFYDIITNRLEHEKN